jgi:hypothetical protein
MLNTYYVTLVRSLTGLCVKFRAPNEAVVRQHCALYYGKLWCSVYTERPSEAVINPNKPVILEEAEWE